MIHDKLSSSRLWTSGMMPVLKLKVLTGRGGYEAGGLVPTGIPPHIIQAHVTMQVKEAVDSHASLIRADIAE